MSIEEFENKIINADCFDILKSLPDKSIDLILTDPPYLYTECEFDKIGFDENLFFSECYRVLKDNSFIVFTGYGDSFYRWNIICSEKGFVFKENPVWNKIRTPNFICQMPRQHEQISIRVKGKRKLNKITINYIEDAIKANKIKQLVQNIDRINSLLNTNIKLATNYIDNKNIIYDKKKKAKFNVSVGKNVRECNRGIVALKTIVDGRKQTTIFNVSKDSCYDNIHPTQKPVALMEYLIKTYTNENETVLDFTMGSGTTGVACKQLNRKFIGIELDKNYYEIAKERIKLCQNTK